MKGTSRYASFVAATFLILGPGGHATALAPEPAGGPPELIVLLRSGEGAPTAEEVVRSVTEGLPLPGALGAGSPTAARFLLAFRAQGAFRAWLAAHPDHPRARLERHVVLTYEEGADLSAIRQVLAADSGVQAVGRNPQVDFSALNPSDPYFLSAGTPLEFQWGLHVLNFPASWEFATGHAYVGIADGGIESQSFECNLTGYETGHPDLRAFDESSGSAVYSGGSFRTAIARDFGNPDSTPEELDQCVDELQPERAINDPLGQLRQTSFAGHGTHVAGIVAATTNNGIGVAGSSWHSSLMVTRISHLKLLAGGTQVSTENNLDAMVEAITWLADHGSQAINMSFGILRVCGFPQCAIITCFPEPNSPDFAPFCDALAHAADRDVAMVAASGNMREPEVHFPARDPRVVAVGGLQYPGVLWDDPAQNAGSNFGADQELVAPAREVLSTLYTGYTWNLSPAGDCRDDNFQPPGVPQPDGYGRCTGTSMAAPHVTGLAGLLRSTDPLLGSAEVRHSLRSNASQAGAWTPQLGFGFPDAAASVLAVLGTANGQVLPNRLTPLFSFYSGAATDHFYTTVPQMATAALYDVDGAYYQSLGAPVPGYTAFPGILACDFSPCQEVAPRASVYLFTTDKPPFPGADPLVPLYRLSYQPPASTGPNRDHFYTTSEAGILAARSVGYELDGVEGYMYPFCNPNPDCTSTPGCAPSGTVPLHRRYNAALDDHAIFPESELPPMIGAGYTQVVGGSACIGYVYPNRDADGDLLIDGFEELLGTDPILADSDCDGSSDGQEVLSYPRTDPRSGPGCLPDLIFADDFEAGSLGAWSASLSAGGGSLSVKKTTPIAGDYSLSVATNGSAEASAYVQDDRPQAEPRYRVRLSLRPGGLAMAEGSAHYVFVARSATGAVMRLNLRYSASSFALQVRALQDEGSWAVSAWASLAASSSVEVDWKAASAPGAGDGYARLWIDAVPVAGVEALDNDQQRVERALLGAISGVDSGTSGAALFDRFESRRYGEISP